MIKLDRPVIVEGKYDVIKLSNLIDGLFIKTDGFGSFAALPEKMGLLYSQTATPQAFLFATLSPE